MRKATRGDALMEVLQAVKDPEIPDLSILELGMVNRVTEDGGEVKVELMPTFVGCPALDLISRDVRENLFRQEGVKEVEVKFVMDPPWTSDRITPEGREKLKGFGIAPPRDRGADPMDIVPECPYCGAGEGEVHNLFGPTACRSIFYCKNCRQPFEGMKPV
ncbi:ring-1,2-phenylacetyl-CoA epoxidase subunit PaaD [Melghirimyces profundicolus]|uniref:Ring-1,2-phenylacetyl-CoA epoxidase subunit PaaD n=1 Tax=Melghirimyces profundicolus TaxID=1242148 RepID=A0A2T6C4U0_9BACL|nr:1,2-phenylacetyl-CoA epoxidase subunit PaaD [Melghirimyces profundicolus]PTX63328.1 ring-1,2-phenylacetyl-CoA epoxidase subunit PaaD [Melghirimyces profundicolus]